MSHPKELKTFKDWWEANKELYPRGTEGYNRNAPGHFGYGESDYDKERKYHDKQDDFTRQALAAKYKKSQVDAGVYEKSYSERISDWVKSFKSKEK